MLNKLKKVKLLSLKIQNYSFGLTTLHAWIRFMECILNITYLSDFCKWAAMLPDQKQKMSEAKKRMDEWLKMPVTVHKVIIHGAKVIENASLPIGQLTEEAQEANNNIFKRIREFNTRKICRIATNEDLGHKLLIMTDPYINYFRTLHENLTLPMKVVAQVLVIKDD